MKKGLGRGFDALIPTDLLNEEFDPTATSDTDSKLQEIRLNQIEPDPAQPRRQFEETALQELASSIKIHGVVQPLVLIKNNGTFTIVAGERRYRAAKLAGLKTVPCIVRSLSAQHRLEISLIENLQRRDLNPLETATAYLKLREQFNLTLEQIGRRVGGVSTAAVSNKLRLLKLPKMLQQLIFDGQLSEGQARPLIELPSEVAESIAERAVKEGWSSRRVEQAVTLWRQSQDSPHHTQKEVADAPYADVTQALTKRYKTDIQVQTNTRGAGKIVIRFKNASEFERIRQLLG